MIHLQDASGQIIEGQADIFIGFLIGEKEALITGTLTGIYNKDLKEYKDINKGEE